MSTKKDNRPSKTEQREAFRKELMKVMPGLKWTVHKNPYKDCEFIQASAFHSSGSNRLFTIAVTRRQKKNGIVVYEAMSSGYGTRAKWLHTSQGLTAARALRNLQTHYQREAAQYRSQTAYLEEARSR